MGYGPEGFGAPIQPDISLRAGLQHSHPLPHPHSAVGDKDPTDQGGGLEEGFFTQSLATSQSSLGSKATATNRGLGSSYERDHGSDGELLALLDVFHTNSNNNDNSSNAGFDDRHGARASQRSNGYEDPLGAPFPPHEGQGLGGAGGGYDDSDGLGAFTSVTAVGGLQGLDHHHHPTSSSSSRGVGEEKGGGGGSVGGVDMKGLRWTTLDARCSTRTIQHTHTHTYS